MHPYSGLLPEGQTQCGVQKALGSQIPPFPEEDEPEGGEVHTSERRMVLMENLTVSSLLPPSPGGQESRPVASMDRFPMHRPGVHDPAAALDYGFCCVTTVRKEEPCSVSFVGSVLAEVSDPCIPPHVHPDLSYAFSPPPPAFFAFQIFLFILVLFCFCVLPSQHFDSVV